MTRRSQVRRTAPLRLPAPRPVERRAFRAGLMGAASPLALGLMAIAGMGTAHGQAVNLGGQNNIVADGRTKTNITVNGNTTSITTQTVSGGTGFNSFSDFQQAAGTRVDMYVPDGAGNLLNIVRNGPVVIDGVLNAYKNGEIGGNIYFSDSHGFVVGANGAINVGTLTVNTPTSEFLDSVVRPDGSVDDAAAGLLLHGTVPISPDGVISIAGTINAKGGITLNGHDVDIVGGQVQLDDPVLRQKLLFESTVNSTGVVEGGRLVVENGQVSIVATDRARVGGTIKASGSGSSKGGTTDVRAKTIVVDGAAKFEADGGTGGGAGGLIGVVATDRVDVEDGAFFSAHGYGSSLGGFVELSGKLAKIGAVTLDLNSDSGAAGTFLIDPDDLVLSSNIISGGANIIQQATNSITVGAGVIIDSTGTTADGNITLESALITIADGAWLKAGKGDITLTAAGETAGIVIGDGKGSSGPTLSGKDVTLSATAEVGSAGVLLGLPSAEATIVVNRSTITASGRFTAEAMADIDSGVSLLPVGIIVSDALASVTIGSTADISADSASLTAAANVVSEITTQSLLPGNGAVDGAVAVSTIDSDATVTIGGAARIRTTGALDLKATNTITAAANATPDKAALGASIAVSVIDANTAVSIGGDADVEAGDLNLAATTVVAVEVTAMVVPSGATEAKAKASEAAEFIGDEKYAAGFTTTDGKVSVVGGLGISDLTSTTTANIGSSKTVTVGGDLSISTATANSATIVADGTAVQSGSAGVGVAVGINLAHVSNDAGISGSVSAGSVTIEAGMADIADPDDDTKTISGSNAFSTTAMSGAGSDKVGIAGSLATNLIDTQSSATITGSVDITDGDVSLSAVNSVSSSAAALPSEAGASGGSVGIGASVAVNIVANRSIAEIGDNAAVIGAGDVSLSAEGDYSTETEAEAGSAGGISLTPALGLSLVSNTTTARLGSGDTLEAESISLSALHQAETTTSASAAAAGDKAAIGAALGLAIVNDEVIATTARNLDASKDITFRAMGASFSSIEVTASASGGEAAEDDGDPPPDKGGTVDDKVDTQLASGQDKQTKAGVGTKDQQSKTAADVADKDSRSASTSEGKVSVAAAVGVNMQTILAQASVPDDIVITAAGSLNLVSATNVEGNVTADGTAADSKIGIGAAVTVNKVAASNAARLGTAAHSLGGLTVSATKTDIAKWADDSKSTDARADVFSSSATSGAGGEKIGIAGSLALNLIDTESAATIAEGSALTITNGGSIALTADNRSEVEANAAPAEGGASGGSVGVGVSAAINILANRSIAQIEDDAVITGANNIGLEASGEFVTKASAQAGSSGGVSITPALGLNLVSNSTIAMIGTGNTLSATSVSVGATQETDTTTTASGEAAGEKAAVGAALALALIDDQVVATTSRSITVTGDVSFAAAGKSAGTLESTASASGGKEATEDGKAEGGDQNNVDGQVNKQLGSASTQQSKAGVGTSAQQSKTSDTVTKGGDKRSAQTSEGKLAVAAAVAVNVTSADVTAFVPDAVVIDAGGSLTITSANTTSGGVTADGTAVGASKSSGAQVGVGVAAAVNVIEKTNSATLGVAAHKAQGVEIAATQYGDPDDPDVDTYETTATSGAGASKVGIAGSLALNLIDATTSAQIKTGASLDAGAGASIIVADQRMSASASALPSGNGASGGKVGLGASVALNLITTHTSAALSDGATITGGEGLAVSANSELDTTTKAEAGASGGIAIDAVVALAMIDQNTSARIGTGTGLDMAGGDVSVEATSGGTHEASADGSVKAANVGIGAAAAVIIGGGTKNGDLANTSVTSASLMRDVSARAVSVTASSDRDYVADAQATAGGGKSDTKTASGGQASSADTLNKTKNSQQGTKGGTISVAAAVGVAAAQDLVSASIGAVQITATGDLTISAGNDIDVATSGSGEAVNGKSKASVGVGVALGIINNSTTASVATGAQILSATNVTVEATNNENVGKDFTNKLTAGAVAGASSSGASIAGAVAVGISTSSATASIGNDAKVTTSGDVAVTVTNKSKMSAKALAYSKGNNVGIGASVATVVSDHDLLASIGAGNTIVANDVTVSAVNEKFEGAPLGIDFKSLSAVKDSITDGTLLGAGNYYAEAVGGAAATGGGGVAVQGSFAVMVFKDSVTASIGDDPADTNTNTTTVSASGDVTITANNDLLAKAVSGGVAFGKTVGVGVSSSAIDSTGVTRALLGQNAEITKSSSFAVSAAQTQDIDAFSMSAGAASTAGISGVATVILSANTVEALLAKNSSVTSSGDASIEAGNDIDSFVIAGGAAGGSTAGVGAAASVLTVNNITRAAMADGTGSADAVTLEVAGDVTLSAKARETGLTIAASGQGGGTAGVAAAAAVYVLDTTTEALIGKYAVIGSTQAPSAVNLIADDATDLQTYSGVLAGGGTAGAGAGAAVGVVEKTITAQIGDYADVTADDMSLSATATTDALTTAAGVGLGGTAGLAGSASVYSVTDVTTARIGKNATLVADNNVAVLASDDVTVDFISGAIGGGGTAAVGAAASVALVTTTTTAVIDDNASVTALGKGDALTYITGYAPALSGAGDYAAPPSDKYTVATTGADNEILTAEEAQRQGLRLLGLDRDSTAITAQGRGVVVNATGETAVRSLAVGAGLGGAVGVAISANVPVITTTIAARIGENTRINVDNATNPGANQSVIVVAAGDLYRVGLAGSLGGAGAVGIGGGVETAIATNKVTSTIGKDSTVNASNDVIVSADSHADVAGVAVAAGLGGTVGVAGGFTVFAIDSTTTATIGDADVEAGGTVAVLADDTLRTAMVSGSLGVGGVVGVGGSLGLTLLTKHVEASIADGASVAGRGKGAGVTIFDGDDLSSTRTAQGVAVQANSNESAFTLAIAGGAGVYVGVSGTVSVQLFDVATIASIGKATINGGDNSGANAAQDVAVIARDSTSIAAIDGGLAVGTGGISGALDVGVLRNTTAASISDAATINAKDRVDVAALQNVDVSSTVISAGGGLLVGIAAGVSVYSIGDGIDPGSQGDDEINSGGSLNDFVQGQVGDTTFSKLMQSSDDDRVKDIGTRVEARRSAISIADLNTPNDSKALPPGASATIGSAAVTAGNAVTVASLSQIGTDSVTGVLAGGAVGLGAGIGVTVVDTTNTAQINGTSTVSGGSITVDARSVHALTTHSIAGAFGVASAQAAVAVLVDNSTTLARINGTTLSTKGAVNVSADDERSGTAATSGLSGALAYAVGASVAYVNLGGTVEASLGQGTKVGTAGNRVASLDVSATSANTASASAEAVSAGIGLAAVGSAADATTGTIITASATGAIIYSTGNAAIGGAADGRASADAFGVAAGSLAVGGSLANATVADRVATSVTGGTTINAGSITLSAEIGQNATAPMVDASATGSAGAIVGITATEANAVNNSQATVTASASTLDASGALSLSALSNTAQRASVDGSAGGIIAAGSNSSLASSNTITTALLIDMVSVEGGSISISANGTDSNEANATSGSGGLIAGSAATATTSSTSQTTAGADTSEADEAYAIRAEGGSIEIAATHSAIFAGRVDSVQASLVGASGATLNHAVNARVDAYLGKWSDVVAEDMSIAAANRVTNYFIGENDGNTATFNSDNAGWNVDSGSGGLVNLPAGAGNVAITQNTNATIGDDAKVNLQAGKNALSDLQMSAHNITVAHQKARLDSGGAIALADTTVTMNVTANATVGIGETSDVIVDVGDITLAAWSDADLEARAAATTYGLAGAPSGAAFIAYTTNNNATIADNVRLEVSDSVMPAVLTSGLAPTHGTIGINAGAGLNGALQTIRLRSTVDLFNKTAIPISTTPDARSTVASNGTVSIGTSGVYPGATGNYGVNAAGDITLRASRGTVTATAVGTGKDIYREELAKAASAISNAFGGGDVTFDYHGGTVTQTGLGQVGVDGIVQTGLKRDLNLVLSYDPTCDVTTRACVVSTGSITYTISDPEAVGTGILDRMRELKQLLVDYDDDPVAKGAYQAEILFLEKKLVALGLGTYDDNGVFQAGTYAGPSDRDLALAVVADSQVDINNAKADMVAATGGVVNTETYEWGNNLSSAYDDATYGLSANANLVLDTVETLTKYASLTASNGGDATFKSTYASVAGLISAGETAAETVRTLTGTFDANGVPTGGNALYQKTINDLTRDIQDLQTSLAAAQIANSASVSTILTQINTKQTAIEAALDSIASNNTQIATQSALAKSKAADLKTALDYLITTARTANNSGDDTKITTLDGANGARSRVNSSISGVDQNVADSGQPAVIVHMPGISDLNTSLQSFVTGAGTRITTLKGTDDASLGGLVASLKSLTTTYADNVEAANNASNTSGDGPKARSIIVADTMARLGNIEIIADQLNGGAAGKLLAPGDARISITNHTANTLKLGNLVVPSYDAGRVRFNGVMVASNADINRINVSGTGADFNKVETALTSSRPQISIVSNYNPESASYYNTNAQSPLWQRTLMLPPDIILETGKVIDNSTGAVNITSAAGNIYINGAINAGSVNILAKNGDFVSSYVNGFNHIGGDPASFNSSTRYGEAGKGITANGAISIAARYINVNSTIQSGIASWTVNLNGTPTLTTVDPTSIGLTQTAVDDAIDAYKDALLLATSASDTPSMLIDMGNGVTLNMGPAGLTSSEAAALKSAIGTYLAAVVTTPTTSPLATVTIGGVSQTINLKDYLSAETLEGRLEFSLSKANTYAATAPSSNPGVYGVLSPGSNIGVSYDARNGQYVVDGTSVKGGSIQLYGTIMNTAKVGANEAPAGKLNVLDGFGTINITNTSNIPVVLGTLKTGDDSLGTGRGVQGKIDIMDITGVDTSTPGSPIVSAKHTVYTRDYVPGSSTGQIKVATDLGTIDNATGNFIVASSSNSTGGDRSTTYDPTDNLRFVWTSGEYKQTITYFTVKQDQLFGSSTLTISESTQFQSMNGPNLLDSYRLKDGTYVTTDRTQNSNAGIRQTASGLVITNAAPTTTLNSAIDDTELVSSTYAYASGGDAAPVETGRRRDCNWWTLCIASKVTISYKYDQKYTIITTNSLKADNAIGINFIGSNTGGITVQSNADVVLTNNVTAAAGDVSITASTGSASIVQGGLGTTISGKNVSLSAAGSVGGITYTADPTAPIAAPIAVSLNGGSLNASAGNGNVMLTTRGSLVVNQVTASGSATSGKGNVNLTASGSISGLNSNALIQGNRVALTAINGSVGSTSTGQLLNVNTGFTYGDTTRQFGDPALDNSIQPNALLGLAVVAGDDIGIRSTNWSGNSDGTMLVERAISLGGDVRLSSTGQILDNNPVEGIDSRTYDQLLGYWSSLGLLAEDDARGVDGTENAAKQLRGITAFENSKTASYDQYWRIRAMQADGGAVYDPNFQYKVTAGSAQETALKSQYATIIRAQNPGYDDSQVNAAVLVEIGKFETAQTLLYRQLNSQVGGLTATYNAAYRYVASLDEKNALTDGAVWTERELAFSLSPGALKTVTATNPVLKDPNVSGRTITLEAKKGIGETIGAGTANLGISIPASIDPRNLTMDQKVALAAAERSDLQLKVVFGGSTVDIPLGANYNDLTTTQKAALDAAAAGLIPQADMTIVILSKRPLNFNAQTALNVSVTDAPDTTVDKGAAYLASRGNGLLDTISVLGETRIKVMGSLTRAGTGGISTGNLILEAAQGGIGTSNAPFTLSMTAGKTLTARAQGGIYVNLGADTLIDTVYSPNDVTLNSTTGKLLNANADQLINILGKNVTLSGTQIGATDRALNVGNNIGGSLTVSAGGLINLYGPAQSLFVLKSAVSTSGRVVIETADDALITGVSSGYTATDVAAVDIVSGGRLYAGNDANRAYDISAAATGVSVSIKAADGIGDKTLNNGVVTDVANPLRILAGNVVIETTNGDMYAQFKSDVTVSARATNGSMYLTADADFHGLYLEAPKGTVSVVAQGDLLIDKLLALKLKLSTGGKLELDDLEIGEEVELTANELKATIKQTLPATAPLKVTLTGPDSKGGIGQFADVTIDAPEVIIPVLRFYESDIKTTARFLSVLSAYVPGSAKFTTPLQTLLVENRSPQPLPGSNVQMYQPTFDFGLTLDGYRTTTTALVVNYDRTAQVTQVTDGVAHPGASLVRDTIRAMSHGGDPLQILYVVTMGADGQREEHEFVFDEQGRRVLIDGVPYPISVAGEGPAVQISQLN